MDITKEELEDLVGRSLNFSYKDDGFILATSLKNTTLGDDKQDVEGSGYEWFQIFDHNDEPYMIDGDDLIFYRDECHGEDRIPNVYHRGADVWIINSCEEIMVSIRDAEKDLYPLMGDNSVGEHNNLRESYLDTAVRGFKEELGILINPQDLRPVCKLPVYDKNQWQWSQYYTFEDKDARYVPCENEISKIRWYPIKDLLTQKGLDMLNFRPDHLPALRLFLENYKK